MKQLVPALFVVGAIMALTGAAVFITGWIYAPYIYTIGAGLFALAQVNTPVKGKGKTLKRLRVQQIFGALALILTGAFMFTTRGNEWIACLTIAAILELYTAFRIPQEEEKEKSKKKPVHSFTVLNRRKSKKILNNVPSFLSGNGTFIFYPSLLFLHR